MRRELEILAQIDDFLEGRISKEELAKELEDVQNLEEHIQTQKALKVAMKKDAFMQQSKSSLSKFKLIKTVKTALVVITVLAAVIGVFFNQNQNANLTNSNTVKEKELIIAISDSLIKTQYFEINNLKDTLIVTNEGIVFFIPKNGFITGSSPIYQLEIKEALSPAQIVKGGLSTLADNDLLETGGMFKISAFQAKMKIYLNDSSFIDFFVPTTNPIPGMQGYIGELNHNGEINWTKPKKLENPLTPANIAHLNFHPPKYREYLKNKGWMNKRKSWKDSVYFDLSQINTSDKLYKVKDTLFNFTFKKLIPPHRIKSFWNSTFNHTLLATKEFENRMPLIHEIGDERILNLYTTNLNEKLYKIDSMAIELAPEEFKNEFRDWYCLKQGKVPQAKSTQSLMKLEKALKISELRQGKLKTSKKFLCYRGKLMSWDLFYYFNIDVPLARRKAIIDNDNARYKRLSQNFEKEKTTGSKLTKAHAVPVRSHITIKIKNAEQFKRKMCFAYLLRKDAYTFEKLAIKGGVLNIEHQNLKNYNLAIIGLNKGQHWLLIPDKIENGSVELILESEEGFNEKVNQIGSSNRFKTSLTNQIIKANKNKSTERLIEISIRLQISKAIYTYSIDTVIDKNYINVYDKNKFTIQTMDYDWISRRAAAIPTKKSNEINFIKGFLNTKEYKINRFTKDRFRVEVFDDKENDVLKDKFYLASRKTDEGTRQQNISFGWSIKDGATLLKGIYNVKLYYDDRIISSKTLKVK